MDIKPLTVCLAVCAALFAVCHGCSTGKEFITSFLPNFQSTGKNEHKLHVVLTAQDYEADVHIQVSSVGYSEKLKLSAHESRWVSLPCGAELQKPFMNANSAVRISSSAAISVVSFNQQHATGDGAVISPIEDLGTEYFVFTPPSGSRRMDKLAAIVNGKSQNRITIMTRNNVILRGNARWRRGKEVTITLAPYATYLLRCRRSLTGMRIRSEQPVAVVAGHQCLSLGGRCEHVYEQLPAVANLGKEYMVPRTTNCKALNLAAIVAVEDNTVVTIHKAVHSQKQKLRKAGTVIFKKLLSKHPMVVKSNKKIMVLLLSNNFPNDPFLITLTPSCKLHTDWSVETVGGLENTVSILSEREGARSVKVCVSKGNCKSPKWKRVVSDRRLAWANVAVGNQQGHVTVEGDARMAVYVYGGSYRHGFGIAGVCSQAAPPPPPPTDPCDNVKCRVKERCVKGECVHVSTATCHVLGDPHYMTFDGRCYDFQGSCNYIMSTVTKGAPGLEHFTVTTQNNNRGSRYVSYVRTVTISVYKQTITIGSHKGRVQVNGELRYLPVSLLGGKICIRQSGTFALFNTDFGLNVKYDWNTILYITVPSSYYQQLGGLCGNYNGDRSDDLAEPKGSSLSAVLTMIQKWKLKSLDLFCSDNCAGRCPQCSIELQTHYRRPALCGILAKPDGPFAACHKTVDPSMYLDNCVYDVCLNKGARQDLCSNLKNYADACLAEGVKVDPQWRMVTKCSLPCPAGSHYEACGSACPATCSPDTQMPCPAVCVEGCQCDKGMVLSGNKCVPKSSCGCQFQGKYYPAAVNFWGDDTCTSKCQCSEGKAKCKAVTCKKNEHCGMKGGVRDCYPTSYATCIGSGDPHYSGFDKQRFDFQGTCTYVLSQLNKGADPSLEPFKVLVKNENRGNCKSVSYTKSVSLIVFGNVTVSMSRTAPGVMLLNSRPVNLPYCMDDGKLSLFRRGYFGFVTTYFGLTLRFNWNSHISLTLPSSYSSATGGLCGNYNGNSGDDLAKPDGIQAKTIPAFGHSWKAGGEPGCTSDCPGGKCPECEPALVARYQERRYCGIIADKNGPFKQCHSKLDHTTFLGDCVFDLCLYQGHASALCSSLTTFSTACQEAGAKVENWRTPSFCPPSCGLNSHYEIRAPPCQLTCSGLTPPAGCNAKEEYTEGCVCDEGFMLSHDKCVPLAECGCQYKDEYYKHGQVFYPGGSCNVRCVCSEGGQVECDEKFHCSANEQCAVKEGSASCCPKTVGSCSVSGVREVTTFDGKAYPLQGNCLFRLAEVEEKEGGVEAFSVYVRQQTNEDGTVTRNVEFKLDNIEIELESGDVWEVKVDDIKVSLPLSLAEGKVRAHQNGIHIIIETNFDLKLSFDTVAGVFLQLPSTYRSSTQGLCGNYNGEPSDDLAGKQPADIAAAWIVNKENATCNTSVSDQEDKQKVPEAEKACSIIKAPQGPFAGCHSAVPPTPSYDACVREMSAGKLAQDILCRHIQNYVASCQIAGAKINKWRSDSFCPVKCPSGSHYELCSTSCSSTCYSLQKSEPCPACQEGCQCDDGLVSDGDRCVPFEKCGCMVDGLYYKSDTTVLVEDCSERCDCSGGHFRCNSTSCPEKQECDNRDGTLGCYSTDPCAEVKCRVKEHCEVSDGQGECVADSKALCWSFGDPHFTTFDGWSYSFQGTCSYVLVNTTGADPTLPEVIVTTKNELRGNSEGSFVRSATVEMLGHSITIPRTERGVVLVDGIKAKLPVFLEGGSICITQAGMRGILHSDIGVEVTFDWSTLVMVSLSSSYYGNVAGLCGNYNGKKEDELTRPSGGIAANVTNWAESWSVEDNDPFCYHFCDGVCPQCSEADRTKYTGPQYCGLLSNKNGPFAGCHSRVPVDEVVADCLYDVCINNGRREVLCEALSNYMAECQEAGASVLPWRQMIGCPVECPAHSQYKTCGSACPATCGPQQEVCPKICVEGCFCDPGYVLSGKQCVIKEKGCGCNHDGRYYLPGTTFWADSQCKEKCECDSATQKVTCKASSCRTGERCGVVDGVQDCYPVSFKTCTAHGDPHFTSFDGRRFDFQGNCVYKMASNCGDATGLTPFEVNLENNNRGNKKVSYAKVVTVKVYGNIYTLSVDHPGRVLVNGLESFLPFCNSSNQSELRVYRRHRMAVLETNFLKVSFDFASAVRVELATSYHNATCGLCGNFNNQPADDLMLPNGKLTSNANEFGSSQWVADVDGCTRDCRDCAQPLPDDFKPPSYTSVCNIITAKDGPLSDCVDRVDSKQYRDDCIYDMVLNDGKQQAACDIISDYVEECQRKEGCVKSWRTRHLCWMKCAANSTYNVAAPGCPLSCNTPPPSAECKVQPSEGCVCDPGHLLSEDHCVPLAECGCTFNGQYIPSGKRLYADHGCQRLCVCHGGMVVCKNKPCRGQQTCGVRNGVRGCYGTGHGHDHKTG